MSADDLPFNVFIKSGHGGASHSGCDDSDLYCDAFSGGDADLVRMLVVAEADEVFMADQDRGWDCGASTGEGLSRVLATNRYPHELGGFASAPTWLQSGRGDFVTLTDPSDQHFVSIGCSTLFINYLRFQLDYSFEDIAQAGCGSFTTFPPGSPNLQNTYKTLTGRGDGFAPFKALLDRRFAAGTSGPLTTDNPFPIRRDLVFYDPGAGTGELYTSDINGDITLLGSDPTWRHSWSIITLGHFSGERTSDLLFYDPGARRGELYTTDGGGRIHPLGFEDGWRSTWNMILPGRFGDHGVDGLLFYDRAGGTGEIYTTDGHGHLTLLASHTNWRTTWTAILVATLTRNRFPDLLFYDASAGTIEVYMTEADGSINLLRATSGLPRDWTMGMTCNVTGGQFGDLAFYSPAAGQLHFFTTDGEGALVPLSTQSIGANWSEIHPTGFAEFLFYNASAGVGEYHRTDTAGDLTLLKQYTNWRQTWSLITPGVLT